MSARKFMKTFLVVAAISVGGSISFTACGLDSCRAQCSDNLTVCKTECNGALQCETDCSKRAETCTLQCTDNE